MVVGFPGYSVVVGFCGFSVEGSVVGFVLGFVTVVGSSVVCRVVLPGSLDSSLGVVVSGSAGNFEHLGMFCM